MTDKEFIKRIREARDSLIKAKNTRCTCTGFVLQYEGCVCGVLNKVAASERHLWSLLERL